MAAMEPTDSELVNRARQGDREAFDLLTVRYWHPCRRIAWLYTRNREDAEDQAQNAFIQALFHLDSCDGARFWPWLNKIATNQCKMLHRRERRNAVRFVSIDHRKRIAASAPDPERLAAARNLAEIVQREVAHLPPA